MKIKYRTVKMFIPDFEGEGVQVHIYRVGYNPNRWQHERIYHSISEASAERLLWVMQRVWAIQGLPQMEIYSGKRLMMLQRLGELRLK